MFEIFIQGVTASWSDITIAFKGRFWVRGTEFTITFNCWKLLLFLSKIRPKGKLFFFRANFDRLKFISNINGCKSLFFGKINHFEHLFWVSFIRYRSMFFALLGFPFLFSQHSAFELRIRTLFDRSWTWVPGYDFLGCL